MVKIFDQKKKKRFELCTIGCCRHEACPSNANTLYAAYLSTESLSREGDIFSSYSFSSCMF